MSDRCPPTSPAIPDAVMRDAPVRCPRCGSRMGALASGTADGASRYCGCCGLVVPDAR